MLFSLLSNISQRRGRIDVFYYLVSKEHQFWQSPTGKSAFVEVRESSREVPAYHLSEKIQNWCIEEHKNKFHFTYITPHSWQNRKFQERCSQPEFLPQGKVRVCEWKAGVPRSARHCQRAQFGLAPSRIEEFCITGGQGEAGGTSRRVFREDQRDSGFATHCGVNQEVCPWVTGGALTEDSLSSQLEESGGGDCFFRFEDSSARLQGTWKIKETWHHWRKTKIFQ